MKEASTKEIYCEWTYDVKFEFAKSECGFLNTNSFRFSNFNYCPYCGKKILIVKV